MSDMTLNYPHQTREDAYFEVLEAFLRSSVDPMDPEGPMVEQVISATGTQNPDAGELN